MSSFRAKRPTGLSPEQALSMRRGMETVRFESSSLRRSLWLPDPTTKVPRITIAGLSLTGAPSFRDEATRIAGIVGIDKQLAPSVVSIRAEELVGDKIQPTPSGNVGVDLISGKGEGAWWELYIIPEGSPTDYRHAYKAAVKKTEEGTPTLEVMFGNRKVDGAKLMGEKQQYIVFVDPEVKSKSATPRTISLNRRTLQIEEPK